MFSGKQEVALSGFFTGHIDNARAINWNETAANDPLWNRCIDKIIEVYNLRELEGNRPVSHYIKNRAVMLLQGVRAAGQVKQFFQQHVVTLGQAYERAIKNVDEHPNNQLRQYTCLMPFNLDAVIDHRLLLSDGKQTPLRGTEIVTMESVMRRLVRPIPMTHELDICLDADLQGGEVPVYDDITAQGGYYGGGQTLLGTYHLDHFSKPLIVLPDQKEQQQDMMLTGLKRFAALKVNTLSKYNMAMHNLRDLAVGVTIVVGAAFLFMRK